MSALWRAYLHASILATVGKAQVDSMTTTWLIGFMQWTSVELRIDLGSNDVQPLFPFKSLNNFSPIALFGNEHQIKSEELGHPVWTTAYKTQTLFPWLLKRSKPKGGACVECRPLTAFFWSVDDLSSFKQKLSFYLEIDFQSVWNVYMRRLRRCWKSLKSIWWRSILITSCRCFHWIKSNSKICIEAVSHNCQSWFADIAWVARETVEALGKVFGGTDNKQ